MTLFLPKGVMPPALRFRRIAMRLPRPAVPLVAAALSLSFVMPAAALLPSGGTQYDLGVDTSYLPLTGPYISAFLATLDPVAANTILNSCAHYLAVPNAARSQDTLDFCFVALNGVGTGEVRTFATFPPSGPGPRFQTFSAAPFAAPPVIRLPSPGINLRPDCQIPHYTVDPTDPCY